MDKLHILWLCSWYPNEEDAYRGDFIQRHAMAVAPYVNLQVLHFVEYARHKKEIELNSRGFKERYYYSPKKRRLASFLRMFKWYNKQLKKYIKENGKPAIVHVHIPWKAGIIANYWKKKFGLPFIVSEHHGIYNEILPDNFYTRGITFQKTCMSIFSNAEKVITVSKSLGDEIKQLVAIDNVVIPNVVDTSKFYFRNRSGALGKFRFVHVSNMYPIKNVEKIIDAFVRLYQMDPEIELLLIGANRNRVKKQIQNAKLPEGAIQLKGEIPYEQVAEYISEAHCFILFSLWETQSCVALESLCAGRPVITSRVGGVKELITAQNGLLVEADDEDGLLVAMQSIKQNYNQYHLEQIARDAKEAYSYETVGKKFLWLYNQLVLA